jgi:hypothetical protein
MSELAGYFTLTATAEVRDKDGNLISSTPVETSALVTEQEAAELISALNKGDLQ